MLSVNRLNFELGRIKAANSNLERHLSKGWDGLISAKTYNKRTMNLTASVIVRMKQFDKVFSDLVKEYYKEVESKVDSKTEDTDKDKLVNKKRERKVYDSTLPKRYKKYLQRANSKGLEFKLSVDEFNSLIEAECVYCGEDGGTIDRVDSKTGYIVSNCAPCCYQCNIMKFNFPTKTFLNKVKQIYERNFVE